MLLCDKCERARLLLNFMPEGATRQQALPDQCQSVQSHEQNEMSIEQRMQSTEKKERKTTKNAGAKKEQKNVLKSK